MGGAHQTRKMFLGFSAVVLAMLPFCIFCQNDSATTTLDLYVHVDPCSLIQCAETEECRLVVATDLLQLPVAVCVKTREFTGRDKCKRFSVGSNILNCRTEAEWTAIGVVQCVLRGELRQTVAQTMVRHICPGNVGNLRYIAADFTCCPANDQTIDGNSSTTIPPINTTSSEQPERHSGDSVTEQPQYMTDHAVAIETTITEEIPEVLTNTPSAADNNVAIEDATDIATSKSATTYGAAYLPTLLVLAAIVVLTLMLTILSCWIWKQNHKVSGKNLPTVFVNPYCDDIKVHYETPSY